MELNFKTMASAYLNVLEGYDFIIPEDVPANERTAFHGAAAAAHKSGNRILISVERNIQLL